MTEHTPGPWDVHGDRHTLIGPRNGKQMLAKALHSYCVPRWSLTLEEAQANARLIAAAPSLLDACRECLHQVSTDSDLDELVTRPDKYDRLEELLRAAIAKAEEGESL